jgi:8-oxo-dGTP pyrophosphatase MutT (NUDIX family)
MAPPERADIIRNIDHSKFNPRKAAVMMLLYPRNDKANMVLILRNSYKGVHSSQIAFPGGKIEDDDPSPEHAALRETHEEIGIAPNQITVVRAFTEIFIPPSNFMVFPFLGYSTEELIFNPDPSEVAGIIEFPIADFIDESTVVNNVMQTSYSESIAVPAFKVGDHIVWGATAMILSELKQVLKTVL